MARVIRDSGAPSENALILSNPSILGVDVETVLSGMGGIVATAWVNDKLLSPAVDGLSSGFRTANNTVGQLFDAGTTILSAYGVAWLAKMALGSKVASTAKLFGVVYGGSKAVTAFVPQTSLSARYPDIFPGLSLFGGGAPKAVAGTNQPTNAALSAGIGSPAAGLQMIRSSGIGY